LPLVALSPAASWVLTRRLKSNRPVTDTTLTAAKDRVHEALS
jgi:hypothetical protein